MLNDRIAFIGAGKMAGAIALGLVNKGIPPAQLCAYDPSPEAAKKFAELTGAVCTATMKDALKDAGIVLFAVKPQYAKAAFDEAREHLGGKLLISIAAGLSISKLTQLSGGIGRIIRVMPNTPALVGEGMELLLRRSRRNRGRYEESRGDSLLVRTLPQSAGIHARRGHGTQRKRSGVCAGIHHGACGRRSLRGAPP